MESRHPEKSTPKMLHIPIVLESIVVLPLGFPQAVATKKEVRIGRKSIPVSQPSISHLSPTL